VPRRTSYDVRVPEPPRLIRDSTAATQPRSLRQREAADRIVVPAHTRKVAAATRRLGPLQEKLTSCAGVAERAAFGWKICRRDERSRAPCSPTLDTR
jgi:hypothetical protein